MANLYLDSHCHLEDHAFDEDRLEVYQRALASGVGVMILAGSDLETSRRIVELTKEYKGVYGFVGVHPHEAEQVPANFLTELASLLEEPKVLGIGEIGLDYFYDHSPREVQQKVFREQLELAASKDVPFVVHSRDASLDTLTILKEQGYHKGIFHCYSYSVETLQEILALGYLISLGGTVTFKNAKKPLEVAKVVPLDRLLLETDSPYMTPVPFRGKRNEPSLVVKVAEKIAEVRNLTPEEVGRITWANTEKFFGRKLTRD